MSSLELPFVMSSDEVRPWLLLAGLLIVLLLLRLSASRFLKRLLREQFIAPHIAERLLTIIRMAIWLPFAVLALQVTGVVDKAWAVLSATLAALAIGFVAYWSILSNITAAAFALVFRPFRVGDTISVWDADKLILEGEVLDLNLMFVSTAGPDDSVQRLPNNLLFQRTIRVHRPGQTPDRLAADRGSPFFAREDRDAASNIDEEPASK